MVDCLSSGVMERKNDDAYGGVKAAGGSEPTGKRRHQNHSGARVIKLMEMRELLTRPLGRSALAANYLIPNSHIVNRMDRGQYPLGLPKGVVRSIQRPTKATEHPADGAWTKRMKPDI